MQTPPEVPPALIGAIVMVLTWGSVAVFRRVNPRGPKPAPRPREKSEEVREQARQNRSGKRPA